MTCLSQSRESRAISGLRFVYDGWNLIAPLNSQLSTLNSFVWDFGLSTLNLQLSTPFQPSTHLVSYDGNGNVTALVSAADGSESARYENGPFGEVIRASGPAEGSMVSANPFRFSTKYQDDETDLLYYGYRYYSASTGRWISRDPLEESGGPNLYQFVFGDAVSHRDPLGLFRDDWLVFKACKRCKCKRPTITGEPVAPPGLGWFPKAGSRQTYGNLLTIKWEVEGDPMNCTYGQDERGNSSATPRSGTGLPKKSNYINHPDIASEAGVEHGTGSASYKDYMGIPFISPNDDGQWDYSIDLTIDFTCTSSDGQKVIGDTKEFKEKGKLTFERQRAAL